jgi:ribosomal protein S24E
LKMNINSMYGMYGNSTNGRVYNQRDIAAEIEKLKKLRNSLMIQTERAEKIDIILKD